MARIQSSVEAMSWLREMPRMRLSPAARAAQRSIRWPQLFEGGAQTAPAGRARGDGDGHSACAPFRRMSIASQ